VFLACESECVPCICLGKTYLKILDVQLDRSVYEC